MLQVHLYFLWPPGLASMRNQMLWWDGCSVDSSLLDTLMLFWLSQLICHPPNLSSKVWTSAPATRAFYLSKSLLYFFKTRNNPSQIPMNQFIQLYMTCVFAFCFRSLQGQMFPWIFIPSEYFLALLPTEALSPLTTVKKKKKYKSHAAFDDYFFVILVPLLFPFVWEKGRPTSLILLTRSYFKQQCTPNTVKVTRHREGDVFLSL